MSSPLNPTLYRALVRAFTHVAIANEGEPYIPARSRSEYRRGQMDSPPAYPGEYYRVSCPFCRDTRQRLWINHKFNLVTEDGDDHLYLAHWFNDECIADRETQKKLLDRIYPFSFRRSQRASTITEAPSPLPFVEPALPVRLPPTFPLTVEMSSEAVEYLLRRGFDPVELSARWGVGYCLISPGSWPRADRRLVIPIYSVRSNVLTQQYETYLSGWQARVIREVSGSEPKYLSMAGMRKNQMLYGVPQALGTDGPLVIVEGVTDVWRLGSHAVATLGKSMSAQQTALLINHFSGRDLVVMYDKDARESAISTAALLRQAREKWNDNGRIAIGHLPDGVNDIGEASRETAWEAVHFAISRTLHRA